MVQGGREMACSVSQHPRLGRLVFHGKRCSGEGFAPIFRWPTVKNPRLELGGINPLVVSRSRGSGCSGLSYDSVCVHHCGSEVHMRAQADCPRRQEGDRFVASLVSMIARIRTGPFTEDPEPFMGPVISKVSQGASPGTERSPQSRRKDPCGNGATGSCR